MSHYETLGVSKDASPDEIKRAYREKAKRLHPDKGGKQSDFEPVVHAYEVLKNAERRLLYDATGQDKQPPIELAVQNLLIKLFNEALSSERDIPVVKTVHESLKRGLASIPEQVKGLKERKKKLVAKRKRIFSTNKANLVHMIIDDQIKNITANIMNLEHEAKIGKAALLILKAYSEDWKEPEMHFTTTEFVIRFP